MAKSAVRTMGTTLGKEILRGVLGSIFGGRQAALIPAGANKPGRPPAQAVCRCASVAWYAANRCMTSI